jgi:ribonucleoside-triphosphate reductase
MSIKEAQATLKVVKRSGEKEDFDPTKIEKAINSAMKSNGKSSKVATNIANEIEEELGQKGSECTIKDIENLVYDKLIRKGHKLTAKDYEGYRSIREFQRSTNTIDGQINELLQGDSEYWKDENSNKNSMLLTVQRDYLAGIVSIDMARRKIFPPEIIQAHDEGLIHIHDLDYIGQLALTNCCLINLEDMLQNGTCINNTKIEKPHKLLTATTIATQIITAVSSNQYGGCTITLTHLAPFVRDSHDKYYAKYKEAGLSEEDCIKLSDLDTRKEVEDAVQTFNYQVNSMTNTNGQSPFLTVFMYLGETKEYKKELALLIEEFLKQRLAGMPNEQGVMVTPAFPKLIYTLEEDNVREGEQVLVSN